MSSKKTVEDHLIEQIKKSGYPLEIEVSSILYDSKNWLPFHQQYYYDYEQEGGRTIDIVSFPLWKFTREALLEPKPFADREDMVIECKKSSTHAWVFFTIPEMYRVPLFSGQTLDFLSVLTKGKSSIKDEIVSFLRNMDTEIFLHYDRFKRIAIDYDEIKFSDKRENKGRKEIFEAINQIVKYISYDFGRKIKSPIGDRNSRLLCIYFPVIVFDGEMYECIVEKNVPKLFRRDHILLRTRYLPEYSDSALDFGIDIVRREFFPIFVQIIKDDIDLLQKRISERRDKLREFIEESLRKKNQT